MMQIARRLHSIRWTVILSIIAGLVIAGVFTPMVAWVQEQYDVLNPVVEMHADVVRADSESITVALSGRKLRMCQYVRMQAYMREESGEMIDSQIVRLDRSVDSATRPIGSFDFGVWRIWPVHDDATTADIYAQYVCNGRMVMVRAATVPIVMRAHE